MARWQVLVWLVLLTAGCGGGGGGSVGGGGTPTSPETTIQVAPATTTSESTARFEFVADQPGSSFECRLLPAAFAACSSPLTYTGLTPAAYRFEVRVSIGDHTEATPAFHEWSVVAGGTSETRIDSGPPAQTTATTASFSFSADPAGAGFECALDAGSFEPCVSPLQLTGLAAGGHRLQVRAISEGMADPSPAEHVWTVLLPSVGADATGGPPAPAELGPAPAGCSAVASLEIRNDRPLQRAAELAYSAVPLAAEPALTSVDELILVGPGERRLPVQFQVLSRWGAGPGASSAPIRWLEVAVLATVDSDGSARYSLRHCPGLAAVADPAALQLTGGGGRYTVDTGAASFALDATNPALFSRIELGAANVYQHRAGAGPRLVTPTGATVAPQVSGFEIEQAGPVKAVVVSRGHFAGVGSPCGAPPGYTARFTFIRGSADLLLEFDFVNECGDGLLPSGTAPDGSSWWARALQVGELAWDFPFQLDAGTRRHIVSGGGDTVYRSAEGFAGTTAIAQRRGAANNGLSDWRLAHIRRDASELDAAEAYPAPIVTVGDNQHSFSAQIPWMRYREPQALVASADTLSLRFISEPFTVGEAQGIWNFARIGLAAGAWSDGELRRQRDLGVAALERGLLPRPPADYVNATGVMPPLPVDLEGANLQRVLALASGVHAATVEANGQWAANKAYGLTTWPDIQFDQWPQQLGSPEQFSPRSNYWSPTQTEFLLWYIDGDPKWVWDFAWAQEHTQLKTNYYNLGSRNGIPGNNRGGFVVAVGGTGEGYRYRSGYSSDDYTYNQGSDEAYLVRPTGSLRERFAAGGQTFIARYAPTEGNRRQFVSELIINRQVMQHVNMLRYAADFVGDGNADYRAKLDAVMAEYAQDNLFGGTFCAADSRASNETDCRFGWGGLFHYVSLWHDVFWSYAHGSGRSTAAAEVIRHALIETARLIGEQAVPRSGGSVDLNGTWGNSFRCDLSAGGDLPSQCQVYTCTDLTSASNCYAIGQEPLLGEARSQTLAAVLLGHYLDPGLGACASMAPALAGALRLGDLDGYYGTGAGWWKGAAEVMHNVLHGIAVAETCE